MHRVDEKLNLQHTMLVARTDTFEDDLGAPTLGAIPDGGRAEEIVAKILCATLGVALTSFGQVRRIELAINRRCRARTTHPK